jgi:ribosomal protein S18 acetylase RimI-like enzyme
LRDKQRLKDFFASHTPDTIYLRYGMMVNEMTHERALQLVQLDGYKQLALIGLISTGETKRIIAVGRYSFNEDKDLAEVAFVVHESYRCMGIATYLLRCLASTIRENGFGGITAQVRMTNMPMIDVLDEVLGDADCIDSCQDEITMCWHFRQTVASNE